MPVFTDGGRVPALWAERNKSHSVASIENHECASECIRIALINNMPDAALADTEVQFLELLERAAGEIPITVRLYSLPGVPRGERGQQHLSNFYFDFDDLWTRRFDAAIITGTEPHQPNLRNEPYWHVMGDLLDWAGQTTSSTILSCLAAHASVLYSDGVERRPLSDKQFGVFQSRKTFGDALTADTAEQLHFPHSRWNEVPEDALRLSGYVVLTRSAEAGVDLFVKKKRNSLFVHFQGHPEYSVDTLFKEYRRDIRRFLRSERPTFPTMPQGYFDAATANTVSEFQTRALAIRTEDVMTSFPEAEILQSVQNTWRHSASAIYRNWLQYVIARKTEKTAFVAAAHVSYGNAQQQKRTVAS